MDYSEKAKWGYTNGSKVGESITEEINFASRVKENNNSQLEPKYNDGSGNYKKDFVLETPEFTKRDDVSDTDKNDALDGVSYAPADDERLPEGVTKDPDGIYNIPLKDINGKQVFAKVSIIKLLVK